MQSTPVRERTTLLPRHHSVLTALALGNPLFFHASRGLMAYGNWEELCSNDHPVLVGVRVFGYGRALLLFCCMSGSEGWKAFCAPPGNSFSFANSAIAMRPCFILLNAVTMVTTIVFNHHPGLQNVRSLVALSPVSQSHHAIPGKLTLC